MSTFSAIKNFPYLQKRYKKVFAATADPEDQAKNARTFAEALCRRLYNQAIDQPPSKLLTLETYLIQFKERKLPFEHIYPQLEIVQKVGNYAGHDQASEEDITVDYIGPVLRAVDWLMNWYVQKQLQRPHLSFKEGQLVKRVPASSEVVESGNYELEMVGGAMPLDSKFYISRKVDEEFAAALRRRDSIVLLKGARQVGKTSLLARGIQQARENGVRVILTDCQKLPLSQIKGLENFLLAVSTLLAKQLKLSTLPKANWDPDCLPTTNFENYFMDEILGSTSQLTLWAIDEADYLFHHDFSSEVFALLRSWYNERALNPDSPCQRLSIAIAYATEHYLFIQDPNQSPFNVGTKLPMEDFTLDQVEDLHRRYGSPLKKKAELQEFFQWLGGHPYLVRAGFQEMVTRSLSWAQCREFSLKEESSVADHLRRILILLQRDPALMEVVRALFKNKCPDYKDFHRLRSAGILGGDTEKEFKFRCQLYEQYLRRHLLKSAV